MLREDDIIPPCRVSNPSIPPRQIRIGIGRTGAEGHANRGHGKKSQPNYVITRKAASPFGSSCLRKLNVQHADSPHKTKYRPITHSLSPEGTRYKPPPDDPRNVMPRMLGSSISSRS